MIRRSLIRVLETVIIVSMLGVTQLQAQTTLQQAIASGEVSARFYGNGSSSGESVMVEVSKGPKGASGPQTVTIPRGSKLASSQASAQSMTVSSVAGRSSGGGNYVPMPNILVPDRGTATYVLTAFCAEFHKDNPSSSTQFTLLPPDQTMTCIAEQSERSGLSVDAQQAAVWMYTDNATFDQVNETFTVSREDWDDARKVASACRGKLR